MKKKIVVLALLCVMFLSQKLCLAQQQPRDLHSYKLAVTAVITGNIIHGILVDSGAEGGSDEDWDYAAAELERMTLHLEWAR